MKAVRTQEQAYERPVPQKIRWDSGHKSGVHGMIVESHESVGFIPWEDLKPELEKDLLVHLGRVLGSRSYTIDTAPFHGRENWLIRILDESGSAVGSVWLGNDPYQGWKWDGLVRVGNAPTEHTAKVWQVFERYSDGSYRRVAALDTIDDRIAD
jgi:hypothetical protein